MPELTISNYVDSPERRRALFDFYKMAYPGQDPLVDDRRFEWQSFGNPLAPPGTNYLYHLYDPAHGIVGQNILIPYQLSIGGVVHDALCSTNLIVLRGRAPRGLGHRLIQEHEDLGKTCFAVGITPDSARAFQKRRWQPVDDARLQALFLRPDRCFRYVGKKGALWTVAAPLARLGSWFLRGWARMSVPTGLPSVTHEIVERFDPAWDPTWSRALRSFAIHFVRRADFLNWKYTARQDVRHTIILFRCNGEPVAYLVWRIENNKLKGARLGRIVDMVYSPDVHPKLPHFMINLARRELIRQNVDGVVGVASSRDLRAAYRANGMILSRPQPAIILERGFSLSELRRRYPDLWYITLGDSDLDNYW